MVSIYEFAIPRPLRIPLPADLQAQLDELAKDLPEGCSDWLAEATLCLRLDLGERGEPAAIGTSKFGGQPDLPEHMPWPADDYNPWLFVQQVALNELPPIEPNPLPRTGLLSLFQCDGDFDNWKVFYFPEGESLRRATPPPGFDEVLDEVFETDNELIPYRITARPAIDLPCEGKASDAAMELLDVDRFFDIRTKALADPPCRHPTSLDENAGQLLGHAYGLQADHIADALGYATVDPNHDNARQNWLPLWSIPDHHNGFLGDGWVGLYVHTSDLPQSRFEHVFARFEQT